jgi:hypothetical protein
MSRNRPCMKQNQQHGRDQTGTAYRWMSSALGGIEVAWSMNQRARHAGLLGGGDARTNIHRGDDAKPPAAEPTAKTPAAETTPGNPPQSTSYL